MTNKISSQLWLMLLLTTQLKELWGNKQLCHKAYLTLLIAENQRIICIFATVNEGEH